MSESSSRRSKSVPATCTPWLASTSSRRSMRSRRAGPTRTTEKSDVPPPISATSTISSPVSVCSCASAAAMGSNWNCTSRSPIRRAACSSDACARASRSGSSSTKKTGRPSTARSMRRAAALLGDAQQVQQVAGDHVDVSHPATAAGIGRLLGQRRAEDALHRPHQPAVEAVDVGCDRGPAEGARRAIALLRSFREIEHRRRHRGSAVLERHQLDAFRRWRCDRDRRIGGAEVDRAPAGAGTGCR